MVGTLVRLMCVPSGSVTGWQALGADVEADVVVVVTDVLVGMTVVFGIDVVGVGVCVGVCVVVGGAGGVGVVVAVVAVVVFVAVDTDDAVVAAVVRVVV